MDHAWITHGSRIVFEFPRWRHVHLVGKLTWFCSAAESCMQARLSRIETNLMLKVYKQIKQSTTKIEGEF